MEKKLAVVLGRLEKQSSGDCNKWHIPALVEHVQPDTVSLYLYLNDANDTSYDANNTSYDANDTSYDANDTSYDANDTSSNEHGQRLTKETLINRVLEICEDWITIDEISEKTGKSRQYLRGRIIPEMLKLGLLEKQYPDASTSPNQKYRKKQ